MPYRCSCGYETENGRAFTGHLGRYSKLGHRKIGWVDPETGEVLDSRPRRGSKPKQAAPEVLLVPEGEAAPERRPPAEKADARRGCRRPSNSHPDSGDACQAGHRLHTADVDRLPVRLTVWLHRRPGRLAEPDLSGVLAGQGDKSLCTPCFKESNDPNHQIIPYGVWGD